MQTGFSPQEKAFDLGEKEQRKTEGTPFVFVVSDAFWMVIFWRILHTLVQAEKAHSHTRKIHISVQNGEKFRRVSSISA